MIYDEYPMVEAAAEPWRERLPIIDPGLITLPLQAEALRRAFAAIDRDALLATVTRRLGGASPRDGLMPVVEKILVAAGVIEP